jgi:omega-amidase
MNVTILQTDIKWNDIEYNLNKIEKDLIDLKNSNLVILPEMFTTGFNMNPKESFETMKGRTVQWMKKISNEKNFAICGSIIIKENEKFYNRFIWVEPDGTIKHYDKRHLFPKLNENVNYTKGNKKLIIEYMGFKFLPLICYDLRFPVFSRNNENYDVIIYIANWPTKRIEVWSQLLVARAIENQSYVFGVNRIGEDENELIYNGMSQIIEPDGHKVITMLGGDVIYTYNISRESITELRSEFPFLKDKDYYQMYLN